MVNKMDFSILTDYLNSLVYDKNTPCVDCIVYKNHQMIYRHFAGKSDLEANKDIAGDELYFIFSMTKLVTCTAALQLYEKGKYNLDDPISKYMPEFKHMKISSDSVDLENAKKVTSGALLGDCVSHNESGCAQTEITVKHLFTMTAGFDYNISSPYIQSALADGKSSTRDLVGALSGAVLGFAMVDSENRIPFTFFQHAHAWDLNNRNGLRNALYKSLVIGESNPTSLTM